MAKSATPAANTPAPLPSLDEIESVEVAKLPEQTRGELDATEIAFAAKIVEMGSGDHAAIGPKLADRKVATAAAARIKRLLNRYFAHLGVPIADRLVVTSRIVPKGDGQAWSFNLAPAVVVAETEAVTDGGTDSETPQGETDGETPPTS